MTAQRCCGVLLLASLMQQFLPCFVPPGEGTCVCILPSAALQVPGPVSGRSGRSSSLCGAVVGAHEAVSPPGQDRSAAQGSGVSLLEG